MGFVPGPFFGDVVDFQDAVWGHPCYWWWEEVDSADGGCISFVNMGELNWDFGLTCWEHVGYITRRG